MLDPCRTLARSFGYAIAGLLYVIRTQRNMRIHLAASVLAVTAGILFPLSVMEWLVIVCAIFLVLITETLNTAIEAAVDLTTTEINPLARIAKDCAAGAVLLAAIHSIIVAAIVFLPKLFPTLFG